MTYRYFSPESDPRLFFCSHTGETGINPNFVSRLDELRERCGFPFIINSGYRHPTHPIEAAKEKPGRHSEGIAADIRCSTSEHCYILVEQAIRMRFKGIGIYDGYVHIDDRETGGRMWHG